MCHIFVEKMEKKGEEIKKLGVKIKFKLVQTNEKKKTKQKYQRRPIQRENRCRTKRSAGVAIGGPPSHK